MREYDMFIAMIKRAGYTYEHYDDGISYLVVVSSGYDDELQFVFDKISGNLIEIE